MTARRFSVSRSGLPGTRWWARQPLPTAAQAIQAIAARKAGAPTSNGGQKRPRTEIAPSSATSSRPSGARRMPETVPGES